MAASILKGLHFPPLVASVEIDAGTKDTTAKSCKVTGLTVQDGGVFFQQTDGALPFFPDKAEPILKWAPILDELNDYHLKVTGLKGSKYEVRLGGKPAGTFTAGELAGGVNLAAAALKDGPVADQVKAVEAAVTAKNRYFHDRIFSGVVRANIQVPDWLDVKLTREEMEAKRKAVYEERMARMPDLDAAIRKALEMKPHTVEVMPVK
jgi:hypothetical protein